MGSGVVAGEGGPLPRWKPGSEQTDCLDVVERKGLAPSGWRRRHCGKKSN